MLFIIIYKSLCSNITEMIFIIQTGTFWGWKGEILVSLCGQEV